MNRRSDKDLYSIIGAGPGASAEEIRAAYMARARVLHPDRFDRDRQPGDWHSANGMMAELNEAYAVLRDADSRAEYDQVWAYRRQLHEAPPSGAETPSSAMSPAEFGELASGRARFAEMPERTQSRLVSRQNNAGIEQVQISLDSIGRNLLLTAVLATWFLSLLFDAAGAPWGAIGLLWRFGATLAVGFLIGLNLVKIVRWMRSALTPHFYVTPLYFIRTEYDTVSFRPLWMLKDVAVTHHRGIRSYRGASIVFQFGDCEETVRVRSRRGVEVLFERLRQYDTRLRVAFANRDADYLLRNDDFFQVKGTVAPSAEVLPRWSRVLILTAAPILAGVVFGAAVAVNAHAPGGWLDHAVPRPVSGSSQNVGDAVRVVLALALLSFLAFAGISLARRGRTVQESEPSGAVKRYLKHAEAVEDNHCRGNGDPPEGGCARDSQ